MNLIIRAISLDDRPLDEPLMGSFDVRGGTIGRSDANTLALPDPKRHISRLQAEVSVRDAGFAIRNAGATNPVFVNDRAVAPGDSAPLAHRDELRIGGYLLRVETEGDDDAAQTVTRLHVAVGAPAAARPAVRAAAPAAPSAPRAALQARALSDPFADLLGNAPMAARGDPFAALAARAATPPALASLGARLPDDFDPFANSDSLAPSGAAPPSADKDAAAPDLLGSVGASAGKSVSIDEAFGLSSAASADEAMAAFLAGAPSGAASAKAAAATARHTDPMAMFDAPAPTPAVAVTAPRIAAAFDHLPELHGAYQPPRIVEPSAPQQDLVEAPSPLTEPATEPQTEPEPEPEPVPEPESTAPPLPQAEPIAPRNPQQHELWVAFCAGAGVKLPAADGLSTQQMHELGSMLRAAVDGTLRMMTVRATAKQELRASVTIIRSSNNNPLKFSPNIDVAMEQLLRPPLRGFMPAPAAMSDAMRDLVSHSIATMAGMRAALDGVLARFDPQQLQDLQGHSNWLDSVLPAQRKARLWEHYVRHFETTRGAAQDDFDALFGKAFVAAYEEQVAGLKPGPATSR